MVYAFNSIHDRAHLWDHLRRIASHVSGPWAIAGDFNCVLSAVERVGGNTPSGEIEPFRQCVADCGVIDIAATGSLFTWNNKQKPEERIYSRIDRFLINKDWCDHMPDLYAHFLPEGLMDHTPCIVSSSKNSQRKRCFKYYNMWGEYEASQELKKLSIARDSYLAQKAKQFWMKEGDTNSAYFHGILKKRRNGNRVFMIEDMNGKMCDNPELVQTAFLEYYMQLLGTKQATTRIHRKIIDQGQRCRGEHNDILLRPATGEEIRATVFSIPDNKSPGPDGYTSKFFKDA
ncbi:uncharacterized protein LOC141593148 [Silene latifolia]|uniref:uncharacterized protein LOC141593148 n=1 Tax=Silene latifolia TaxID=37657 RepID=UPI003D778884